ncbi:hypothetical protein MIR68_003731 [Amoeboaphelidium protococcarum]|nr:hypothetical protein MIR68_003731 [Amoeboaphelidium protococcarum]
MSIILLDRNGIIRYRFGDCGDQSDVQFMPLITTQNLLTELLNGSDDTDDNNQRIMVKAASFYKSSGQFIMKALGDDDVGYLYCCGLNQARAESVVNIVIDLIDICLDDLHIDGVIDLLDGNTQLVELINCCLKTITESPSTRYFQDLAIKEYVIVAAELRLQFQDLFQMQSLPSAIYHNDTLFYVHGDVSNSLLRLFNVLFNVYTRHIQSKSEEYRLNVSGDMAISVRHLNNPGIVLVQLLPPEYDSDLRNFLELSNLDIAVDLQYSRVQLLPYLYRFPGLVYFVRIVNGCKLIVPDEVGLIQRDELDLDSDRLERIVESVQNELMAISLQYPTVKKMFKRCENFTYCMFSDDQNDGNCIISAWTNYNQPAQILQSVIEINSEP